MPSGNSNQEIDWAFDDPIYEISDNSHKYTIGMKPRHSEWRFHHSDNRAIKVSNLERLMNLTGYSRGWYDLFKSPCAMDHFTRTIKILETVRETQIPSDIHEALTYQHNGYESHIRPNPTMDGWIMTLIAKEGAPHTEEVFVPETENSRQILSHNFDSPQKFSVKYGFKCSYDDKTSKQIKSIEADMIQAITKNSWFQAKFDKAKRAQKIGLSLQHDPSEEPSEISLNDGDCLIEIKPATSENGSKVFDMSFEESVAGRSQASHLTLE